VRQQISPGQSAAPPWVESGYNRQALKGRNGARLLRPFRASAITVPLPRAALRSALGYIVAAPSVLKANAQLQKAQARNENFLAYASGW
jgi:hypothetical protein